MAVTKTKNSFVKMKKIKAHLSECRKSQKLDLSSLELMEIPEDFMNLVKAAGVTTITELDMHSNLLSELPHEIGEFRMLRVLRFSKNRFQEFPSTVLHFMKLQVMDFSDNEIKEIDSGVRYLVSLRELNFAKNQLMALPTFWGHLTLLVHLNLGSYRKYHTRFEVGQRPLIRTGHSTTQVGPITYIFGGHITNYVKVEEMFSIDSRTLLWVKLSTSGNIPTARDCHSAAFDGNKRLYIFGGRNEENKLLNDIYYLDLQTMTWFRPPIEGIIPSIREGASMVVIGSQLIVFGGRGTRQRYNDVHVLDTQLWTWTLQNTKGSIPAPRQNAAATYFGTKLYVHGGKGSLVLDDLHALDTLGFTWSRVSQKGSGPSPRYNHTCWIFQNKFYVIGGWDAKSEPLSSLYALALGNESKTDLKLSANVVASNVQEKGSQPRNNMWMELETEISPSLTNVFCHFDENLIILQEGTDNAEMMTITVSGDNRNLEGSSWDYYLETSCDNLQQKVHDIQMERPMDSKTARALYIRQTKILQLPKSFRMLSNKELCLLEHVKAFQTRFMQLYPTRRPFMFVACNECNVEKCICTTIRPSHFNYPELFHWESCVSFLANFLTYERLENPVMFPSCLPSPSSVLDWQKADCFDFSVALVSFLTGAGYEAFCVVGYAPLHITTNNQEAKVCPHFVTVKREPEKKDCLPSQRLPKVASVDYLQNSSPILNAQFLQHEKQERESQFSSFFKKFRDSFDQVLQSGQNEEEDNLVSYCMEKCKTKFSPPESPVLQRQDLESEFPAVHGVAATRSTCKLTMSDDYASSIESKAADPFNKNRLHCWVLVSSNKRDVSESFFVEPSTGQRYTLLGSPYQAVEYIWNQHNIWINMQLNPGRSGLDMSWELKDPRKWERVLDSFLSAGDMQELLQMNNAKFISSGPITGKISEISTAVVAKGSVSALDTTGKIGEMDPHSAASKMEATILNGNRPNASMESNPELVSKSSLKTGIKSTSGGPFNEGTNKNTSEADIHCGYIEPYHWLLPPSWIPLLEIPLETYVTRCPKGVKRTHFHQCTHELYSFYGDFVRWDGLIERIILYEDDDRTIVSEIHNYFQRRKDGLYKRIFIPALNKVHDFFNFGASFGLKETEIVDGQSRRFFFYENSRNDGLIRREESIGRKMVESFANHEACLVYRCACYGPPMPPARDEHSPKAFSEMPLDSAMGIYMDSSIKGSFSHPGSVRLDGSGRPISHGRISVDSQKGRSRSRIMSHWPGSSSNRKKLSTPGSEKQAERKHTVTVPKRRTIAENLLPIMKITEKYELRKGAHPKDNVSKHVFKLNMDQIKVKYHHVDRHINASSRLYNKQGSLTLIQVDPFGAQLAAFDKLDEFHSLLVAEREAIKSVRDAEREIEDILQQRLKEEQNVILITPYIDVACVKQEDLLQEGEDAIKLQTDFLSAFLPPGVRPRQKLSRQQMLEVRDSCLRALKDRLVNRATIIQARYDEETAALAKRRANFERDREQMTVEDEELYNQACENAFFRIQILELRAKQHEEEALKKYIEMERKLQHDPRLACLYRGSSN